ncbi:MAG: AI-2E family transporter [Amaricoccus sp.]
MSPLLSPLPRAFMGLGLVLAFVVLMRIGAPVIVPVVEAVLVCFVLNAAAAALRRVPGIGPRLPRPLALVGAALIALAASLWVVEATVRTVAVIGTQAAGYETALGPLLDRAGAIAGISGPELSERLVGGLGVDALMRQLVAATAATINHFGIVAIYAAFLLVDQRFFDGKLRALQPDPVRRAETRRLVDRVTESVEAYLLIMTFVSALTSLLCYAVMGLMGVRYAVFLATMIFFLNYIPTIGSILGTVVPAGFALLQFQAFGPALVVLAGIGLVQFVMGNILLPRMFGTRLNISLGVTIFALFFWGALWGITGMFVAMPLTAIVVIAFSHFDATRPLAILMSRTGKLDPAAGIPDPGTSGPGAL